MQATEYGLVERHMAPYAAPHASFPPQCFLLLDKHHQGLFPTSHGGPVHSGTLGESLGFELIALALDKLGVSSRRRLTGGSVVSLCSGLLLCLWTRVE